MKEFKRKQNRLLFTEADIEAYDTWINLLFLIVYLDKPPMYKTIYIYPDYRSTANNELPKIKMLIN